MKGSDSGTSKTGTVGKDNSRETRTNTMPKIHAYHGDQVVRLVAEFRAWTQTTVKWYKENGEITCNDKKYQMSFENSVAELAILKVTTGDAGQYTVVASSSLGEALLTTNLIVHGAVYGRKNHGETHLLPSILLQPLANLMIRVGKKARLTVAACCPPEPQIQWYRDKDKVQETDKYIISRQGGVCTLDIATVEPTDNNTTWKCEIITGFGYAVTTAKLIAIVPKGYHKPEFLEGLKALLTAQGTVSLECKVVGVPTPLLKWFKDGKEIKAGDMFNLGAQSNDENSLGVYTCVAVNCMGKAVSSAQVTVTEKTVDKQKPKLKVEEPVPVFIEGLEDKMVKVGDNFRFHVRVRTPPPTKVTWYCKDESIEANEKYHLTQVDEGIYCLDLIPMELTDDGQWRCVASNQYGSTTSMCHISLNVPKNYRGPEFVEGLVAIFTDDGLVSFECKVIGVPTPILRWYKDGLELKPGDVHQLSGTNSLGSYSCVAKNCMGLATSVAELTLEDIYGAKERRKPPAKQPPCFTQHLKDELVFIGQNFCFTISVKCPPIPEVTWYKDNVRMEENEKHHIRREKNGVYHLDINRLELNDQGVYKCLAVNDYGHTLTQCALRITIPKQYKKPKFIENLRAVLSEEGTVSLECKVVGVPQPALKWYKDGVELKAGDIYKIVSGEGGTSSLGTYTCEAQNCMGTSSSTAALLAFDDKSPRDRYTRDIYQQDLSTIEEKDEFSTYGTPSVTDNWDESKAEIEFSIYETPDITEDEARQIIEIFADEVSEYVSTREAPELPPLRFIKESAVVGNIIMDALIIDVPIEYCSQVEEMAQQTPLENLATEADIADISAIDPVIVDLPYDYSEAASLHELKIDISENEADVLVRETSFREAVIIDAPLLLSSQEAAHTMLLDKMVETACKLDRSLLEPLVVTCPEKLGTIQDRDDGTREKETAFVVQERENILAKVAVIEPLALQVSSGNMAERNLQQGSQQAQQQMVFEFDDDQLSSEDITPSENLGTDADVESIASVEEFTTDYINGFSDDRTNHDVRAADEEVRRIEEAASRSSEIGRTTPTYESAMDFLPEETNQLAPSYVDATDATPTPTPGYEMELLAGQMQSLSNVSSTSCKQDRGEPSGSHGRQPGMLVEIASAVLHKAAEGIITTAVIAESLVTAATSMIILPEEKADEVKEEMFLFNEEDILPLHEPKLTELEYAMQEQHPQDVAAIVQSRDAPKAVVSNEQNQQKPQELAQISQIYTVHGVTSTRVQHEEVPLTADKTTISSQDIHTMKEEPTYTETEKKSPVSKLVQSTVHEECGKTEQETLEVLPKGITTASPTRATEHIERTIESYVESLVQNILEGNVQTVLMEEEEATLLPEVKPVCVTVDGTMVTKPRSSSLAVEALLVMEEAIEGTETQATDEVIGVASANAIDEATIEAIPIVDSQKEIAAALEVLEGVHTDIVAATCIGVINQDRGTSDELTQHATFGIDNSESAKVSEVENVLIITPLEVISQKVMEVASQEICEEMTVTNDAVVTESIPSYESLEERADFAIPEARSSKTNVAESEAAQETSEVTVATAVTQLDTCLAVSSTVVVTAEDSHVISTEDCTQRGDSANVTIVATDVSVLEEPIRIASTEVIAQNDSIVATVQGPGLSNGIIEPADTVLAATTEQSVHVAAIEVITQQDSARQQSSESQIPELNGVHSELQSNNAETYQSLPQDTTNEIPQHGLSAGNEAAIVETLLEAYEQMEIPYSQSALYEIEGVGTNVANRPIQNEVEVLLDIEEKEPSDQSVARSSSSATQVNSEERIFNGDAFPNTTFEKLAEQLVATCFMKAFKEVKPQLILKVPQKNRDKISSRKASRDKKVKKTTSDEKPTDDSIETVEVTNFAEAMSRELIHDVLDSVRNIVNEWQTEKYFSSDEIYIIPIVEPVDDSDTTTDIIEVPQIDAFPALEATASQDLICQVSLDQQMADEDDKVKASDMLNRDDTTTCTRDSDGARSDRNETDVQITPNTKSEAHTLGLGVTQEYAEIAPDTKQPEIASRIAETQTQDSTIANTTVATILSTMQDTNLNITDILPQKRDSEPSTLDATCNIVDGSIAKTDGTSSNVEIKSNILTFDKPKSALQHEDLVQIGVTLQTGSPGATATVQESNNICTKHRELASEIDMLTERNTQTQTTIAVVIEPDESTNKSDVFQSAQVSVPEDTSNVTKDDKDAKKLVKKRKSVLKKSKSLAENPRGYESQQNLSFESLFPPITAESAMQHDTWRSLSPQDSYDKSDTDRLSDHSDTLSTKDLSDHDDSDVSQDIPRSEGSKESRLLRRNSRKEKRRGSKKSDSTWSLKSQDSRDSSTGEQTDEGEDFPSKATEVHRAKKALRTTSGDLAKIREIDDENSLEAERRRQSCPHVDSSFETPEQDLNTKQELKSGTDAVQESNLGIKTTEEPIIETEACVISNLKTKTAQESNDSLKSNELSDFDEKSQLDAAVDKKIKLETDTAQESNIESGAVKESQVECEISHELNLKADAEQKLKPETETDRDIKSAIEAIQESKETDTGMETKPEKTKKKTKTGKKSSKLKSGDSAKVTELEMGAIKDSKLEAVNAAEQTNLPLEVSQESKLGLGTGKESNLESETGQESKPESETGQETKVKSEIGQESKLESETGQELKFESETGQESKLETETDQASKLKSGIGQESKPGSETGQESALESTNDNKSKPNVDQESKLETEKNVIQESKDELDAEKESQLEKPKNKSKLGTKAGKKSKLKSDAAVEDSKLEVNAEQTKLQAATVEESKQMTETKLEVKASSSDAVCEESKLKTDVAKQSKLGLDAGKRSKLETETVSDSKAETNSSEDHPKSGTDVVKKNFVEINNLLIETTTNIKETTATEDQISQITEVATAQKSDEGPITQEPQFPITQQPGKVPIPQEPEIPIAQTSKVPIYQIMEVAPSQQSEVQTAQTPEVLISQSPKDAIVKEPEVPRIQKVEVVTAQTQEVATEQTPQEVATAQTPQEVATELTPKGVATAQTPQGVVTAQTPQEVATAQTPKEVATAQTPQELVTAQTPQELVTAQTPQELVTAQTPQKLVIAQTPQELVIAQTPQELVIAQTPQELVIAQTPQGVATVQTPQGVATGQTPQELATAQTPQEVATAQTPQEVATAQTPQEVATGQTPQEVATGQTPQEVANAQTPQELATAQTPQELATAQTPQEVATAQTPKEVATAQTPQEVATGQTPQEVATGQTPKEVATAQTPNEVATAQTPQELATAQTPQEVATDMTPKEVATAQTPQGVTTAQTPQGVATAQTPKEVATAQTPKEVATAQTPKEVATAQTPQEVATAQTPQGVATAQTPQGVATAQTPQGVATAQTPQGVATAQTPQGVATAQTPQEVATVQTPQELATAQTPQELATAQTPQQVATAQTPQEVETAQTPQEVETAQTPQEVATAPKPEISIQEKSQAAKSSVANGKTKKKTKKSSKLQTSTEESNSSDVSSCSDVSQDTIIEKNFTQMKKTEDTPIVNQKKSDKASSEAASVAPEKLKTVFKTQNGICETQKSLDETSENDISKEKVMHKETPFLNENEETLANTSSTEAKSTTKIIPESAEVISKADILSEPKVSIKSEKNASQLTEFEKIKDELRSFDLDKVPKGNKMTIEELSSSYEDSVSDKTPINVVIESLSDQTDDDDKTLVQEDFDIIQDMDESLMGIEEIPLEDFSIEDVIENVRTLKRLQTITEVDEITDEEDGGESEHIVIATLKPSWSDELTDETNRRAHSLQPVQQEQIHEHHTVEQPLQRRRSHGDSTSKFKRTKDSPKFIMKLHDFSIPVDYRMRLTCCVIGSPDPKVQWLKNGVVLTPDMGYREINDFGICVLEIPRASHSDSGEFTCIASNIHGQDRTTAQLTVKGKAKPSLTEPTFTRSILNMKGHCGDSITMDCTVIGWPTPNVTWLKDNGPLVFDDRIITKVAAGGTYRLTITEASVTDSGVYRCVAQNPLGKDEITASVKIMDKPSHSSRFVRDSLTKKTTSSSSNYDSSYSYDSYSINGSNSGSYTGYRAVPLTFTSQLEDKRACLGSNVTFHCEITGKPRPEITWLHNGKPLRPNGHIKFSQQDNTFMLTLRDSSYSDLGLYTCRAASSSEILYTSACLSFGLQGEAMEFGLAPIFITKPQSLNVGKDDKIVLTCKVEGKPRPKVTWLKGARDISLSKRAYKDSKGDIHKLIIHRAMNVDDGEYIVEAKNKLGKQVVRCSVTVSKPSNVDEVWDYRKTTSALDKLKGYRQYAPRKEIPGPVASEPRVTDTGRNWVTIMWSRPDNDGGSSILAYRIETCELPDNTWEEVGLSPITICDVYNLKPDSEYLIRVSARNMFGWGPSVSMTEPFKIKKRPDMPHFTSIPPSCLQAKTGSDITLDCLVAGKPTPDVRWYKDRELVSSLRNNRYRTKFDGIAASLTIIDVGSEDEACYMCEAVSDGGRATAFTVLGVEEGPGAANQLPRRPEQEDETICETPPVFTMRLRNRTVSVNHLVRLSCQIQGSPKPDVTWYKDGVEITNSEDYLILREANFYTLEIVRAQLKDAGEYAVHVKNNQGGISSKCQLDIDTDVHKRFSQPTFLQTLENGTALEGQSFSLRCRTTTHPGRKVTWYHDGQKLTHCRKHRIKVLSDGTCVLTIVQVTGGDSGTYTCVVTNESGRVTTDAEIRVQHRLQENQSQENNHASNIGYSKIPVFLTKPRSTEVLEDDTVELLCEVIGDPKPEVLWLRDGLKFEYQKDPEHFLRLGDGPTYRLEIPSVTIDDTGRYAVIACNCHGDTKAIISLQVLARGQGIEENHMEYRTQTKAGNVATRPEVVQTLKNLQCSDGDSVTFECRIRSIPSPEIRWEKDGHILKPSDDFQQQQEGSLCRLCITEIFPEDTGEYVCVAYNDAGRVTTSAKLAVLRSEEKENNSLYSVGDGVVDVTSKPIRKRLVTETLYRYKKRNVGPKFITHPHNRVVDEGETVKFTCSLAGHPHPAVQWEKCGRLIKSDGRILMIDNDDLHSLVIAEVTPHDTGTYTVTATNCIGKVYATAKLDVIAKKKGKPRSYVAAQSPHPGTGVGWSAAGGRSGRTFTVTAFEGPRVVQSLTDRVITSGDRLAIACEVHGNPRPTITWMINDKVLSKRWNCRTKYDGRTASLEIASFEGHHSVSKADISCIASNEHGTVKTTAKLTIKGRTKANKQSPVPTCRTFPITPISSAHNIRSDSVPPSKTKTSVSTVVKKPTKSTLSVQKKQKRRSVDHDPTLTQVPVPSKAIQETQTTTPMMRNGETVSNDETEHPPSITTNSVVHFLKDSTTECPPSFVEHLTDVFTQDGNRVSLNVEVSGTPPFEVIWVRNDKQVLNSDNFSYLSHGCNRYSLVIDDVFPEDAGIYVCEVYNAFGNCETRCKVHVKEPDCMVPTSMETIKPEIRNGFADQVEIEDGERFVLRAQIAACPKPTVTWTKDGHKLQPFIRIKTECEDEDKYTLDIARIRIRDAGIYAVTASNIGGKATNTTAVNVKTRTRAPSSGHNIQHTQQMVYTSQEKDSTLNKNDKDSFMMSLNRDNSVECEEENMMNDFNTNTDDNIIGTVENLTKEQDCPLTLSMSHNLTNVTADKSDPRTNLLPAITIKESQAQIIRGPQNTTVLEGQKVHLKVYFIGKPRPAVKWIKGGRMVESNERVKMETCEEMSCLTMDNVHSDDSGKYIVVVENSHGADCHFASLSVEGAPEPPASKPVVTQASSSAITLCWYGSSYDGGSVITGYIVEVARVFEESEHLRKWQKVTSNCHSTSYVVRGLEPAAEYVFRVRAQNVHGTSRPTEESEPVFIVERDISSGEESRPQSPEFSKVSLEDGCHFNELYDVQEELGKGRFGRVHRVIEKKTGIEYAAKFIRCIKSRDKEKVKEEVDVMNSLCHSKLLKLFAAFEKLREMIIVLEYVSGGELFERVVAEDFILTERDCILFTRQICDGVRYMHDQSIMHLDLKPENILCLHREGHQIKLIDFGLAKKYDPDNPIRVMFGTPEFVAPEVINYEYISPASDMWSVGVICYVLLSGLSPFMGENDIQTFSNITKSEFDFDDEAFDAISQDAKDFIVSLLIKNKEKRMSSQECLKHHWLAQHERTMSAVKLCTDKLKKFIVRRKWQKTGNAILALGRMVSLSGLHTRRTPLYSYSSGFGSNLSDSSDCDTSSNTSYRVTAQGSGSIPETDEDSFLADSSSESYQSDRKDSGSIKSEKMFEKRPSSELMLDIQTKRTTLD